MNEYEKDNRNYEPNFVLPEDGPIGETGQDNSEELMTYIFGEEKAAKVREMDAEAANSDAVTEAAQQASDHVAENAADTVQAAGHAEQVAERATDAAQAAEHTNGGAATEPKVEAHVEPVVGAVSRTESDSVSGAALAAEQANEKTTDTAQATGHAEQVAERATDAAKAAEQATKKTTGAAQAAGHADQANERLADPDRRSDEYGPLRSNSPISDVLKAAAAKADALKAAAAKADQASEPYRRETSDIPDPIYSDMEAMAGLDRQEEGPAYQHQGEGFVMRDPAADAGNGSGGRDEVTAGASFAGRSSANSSFTDRSSTDGSSDAASFDGVRGSRFGARSDAAAKARDAYNADTIYREYDPSRTGEDSSANAAGSRNGAYTAGSTNAAGPGNTAYAADPEDRAGSANRAFTVSSAGGVNNNGSAYGSGTMAGNANSATGYTAGNANSATGYTAGSASNATSNSASNNSSGYSAGNPSNTAANNAGNSASGYTAGSASNATTNNAANNPAGNMNGPAYAGGRPRFENPSFDPGQTGRYTDPRDSFRGTGASASWSNGEVHRNRKQMKDSIKRQKKQKKPAQPIMLTRKALALLVAGCLMLSCLFGLGGAALGTTLVSQNQANTAQTTTADATPGSNSAASAGYNLENATGSSMTIKEITAATKNSVVEIRTESVASDTWMQQYVTQGAGSGVIISEDGYVMTNNHVIEGANKIKVTTADEKEYEATLIGTDDTNDVAVLKIDASGLEPATYGNSNQLEVGDMAVAIGNPLGELGGTVTAGIISATDRELSIDGKTMHLLQTDSSINPGNSGGGLFNSEGQLIGLVVAKSSGSDVEGLGFAIPINTAADVAQQLIDKGYVSGQPSTGMTYQEGTASSGNGTDPFSSFDSFFGSGTAAAGVYIYSVNGENAKKAGFQAGDQVIAVDGEEIGSFDDLSTIITSHKVGDKVTFTILRGGEQQKIKLELEEKTQSQSNPQDSQDQQSQADPGEGNNGNQQPFDEGDNGDSSSGGSWQDWFSMFF